MAKLFIIAGPSGAGQNSVLDGLKQKKLDYNFVVTTTTRKPRPGEKHGVDYYFVSKEKFQDMIESDEMREWAEYAGNYYGSTKIEIKNNLKGDIPVITQIEHQGVKTMKKMMSDCVAILIAESIDVLENRIRRRGSLTEDEIQKRMKIAKEWLMEEEIYDFKVINQEGKLNEAIKEVAGIIEKNK